jgi:uncharacterized protein DUF3333
MIEFTKKAGFDLGRRHRAERRFQWAGRGAIFVSLAFLVVMVGSILMDGSSALRQTQIAVTVDLGPGAVDPDDIAGARFGKILKVALRGQFPDVKTRKDKKKLYNLVSPEGGFEIRRQVIADPGLLGGPQTLWLILMDEPCSALDPIATAVIEELIDGLRQDYTIVIVTHSMQQAARISQRTAFFHMGKLIEVGSTKSVFTTPREEQTSNYITGRIG